MGRSRGGEVHSPSQRALPRTLTASSNQRPRLQVLHCAAATPTWYINRSVLLHALPTPPGTEGNRALNSPVDVKIEKKGVFFFLGWSTNPSGGVGAGYAIGNPRRIYFGDTYIMPWELRPPGSAAGCRGGRLVRFGSSEKPSIEN